MKTIQIIIVLLMVGLPTMEAQNRLLVVKKTDGTTQEIRVKDIVEMTVEEYLPLSVNVMENEMIDPGAPAKVKGSPARAPIITSSTFNSFNMYNDIFKKTYLYTLTKNSSGWEIDGDRWPTINQDQEVTFYAFNGEEDDFVFDNSSIYIQFEVDNSPWDQIDLLVACKYKTTYNDCGGCVNLTFDHVCAAVDFTISMTHKLNEKLGNSKQLKVTGFKLKNVLDKGRYEFNPMGSTGGRWNSNYLDTSGKEYLLTNSEIDISETPESLPCGYLFMIPQDLDSSSQAELEISYKVLDSSAVVKDGTVSIPLTNGYRWLTGKKHTMNIKLNTSMIEL